MCFHCCHRCGMTGWGWWPTTSSFDRTCQGFPWCCGNGCCRCSWFAIIWRVNGAVVCRWQWWELRKEKNRKKEKEEGQKEKRQKKERQEKREEMSFTNVSPESQDASPEEKKALDLVTEVSAGRCCLTSLRTFGKHNRIPSTNSSIDTGFMSNLYWGVYTRYILPPPLGI